MMLIKMNILKFSSEYTHRAYWWRKDHFRKQNKATITSLSLILKIKALFNPIVNSIPKIPSELFFVALLKTVSSQGVYNPR